PGAVIFRKGPTAVLHTAAEMKAMDLNTLDQYTRDQVDWHTEKSVKGDVHNQLRKVIEFGREGSNLTGCGTMKVKELIDSGLGGGRPRLQGRDLVVRRAAQGRRSQPLPRQHQARPQLPPLRERGARPAQAERAAEQRSEEERQAVQPDPALGARPQRLVPPGA